MNKKLIDALDACLQKMDHGESLDSVLAGYPHLAAALRPLLITAVRARSASRESIPRTILLRQRSRGLALAEDLRQGKIHYKVYRRYFRPAVAVLSAIFILVMSSNGILVASAHSIPGDTLYPLKRSVESTQLQLVSNLAQRHVLEQTFSERRVEETKSLITIRRIEDVDFTGVVTSQSGDEWLVSGIPVVITVQVDKDERIEIGDDIDVQGSTDITGTVKVIHLSLTKVSGAEEGHLGLSSTPTSSPKPSGESDFTATPTESSLIPTHSGEAENQVDQSNHQQSMMLGENHSSGETFHTSRTNSEDESDQ
ncbi:MAG: DUF5667 domain-containing protein [Anaerolineales bacterium]|jgi:hypothetical protein